MKCVNAIHSNSLPDGTYGGSAGGFVVESADANFYYSGDTALTSLILDWQRELKNRASWYICCRPQSSLVSLDNRTTNR